MHMVILHRQYHVVTWGDVIFPKESISQHTYPQSTYSSTHVAAAHLLRNTAAFGTHLPKLFSLL